MRVDGDEQGGECYVGGNGLKRYRRPRIVKVLENESRQLN